MVMALHPAARLASPASVIWSQPVRSRLVMALHPEARLVSPVSVILPWERSRSVVSGHPAARLASLASVGARYQIRRHHACGVISLLPLITTHLCGCPTHTPVVRVSISFKLLFTNTRRFKTVFCSSLLAYVRSHNLLWNLHCSIICSVKSSLPLPKKSTWFAVQPSLSEADGHVLVLFTIDRRSRHVILW